MTAKLKWLGMALAVAGSVAFIAHVVSALNIADFKAHLSPRASLALLGSILLYCLVVPLGALAWQRILAGLGHRAGYASLLSIMLTTQAGKYLPGNIGQHIGRIALSLSLGIPMGLLIVSLAYELALLLFADLLTALVTGVLSDPGLQFLLHERGSAIAIAGALALAALLALPLGARLLPLLVRRIAARSAAAVDRLPPLGLGAMASVITIFAVSMLCVGAGFSVLAHGLFIDRPIDFALLTAAFTIAWAVGFVTPGAPAGIGVREALLLIMLSPSLGTGDASLLILALRIATTLGDMLCFVAGLALTAQLRRRSGPNHSPIPETPEP